MGIYRQHENIPQVRPHWFYGNKKVGEKSIRDTILDHYEALRGHRFGLFWEGHRPAVFLMDLDLIKKVQVSDFEHFTDLGFYHADYLRRVGNSFGVSDMTGEPWKKMKRSITQPFSTPRLKKMVPAMNTCAGRLREYLMEIKEKEYVEATDFTKKFYMSNIASVVFGIYIDCYGNTESEFERHGKSLISIRRFRLLNLLPSIAKLFKVRVLNPESEKFFSTLSEQIIKERRNNNVEAKDVLGTLMNVGKENPEMTEEMMYKTCVQFFTDGYESVAQATSVLIYYLTIHPEIQIQIQNEIDKVFKNKTDNLNIDEQDLLDMTYLDQVLSEGFRLGCFSASSRNCTKDWKIPGESFVIRKDMKVLIPIVGLHHDPRYWPDPFKFDPERFSVENRKNIKGITFQPFGSGPRSCLGQNLIKMETKVMLIQLLKNFNLAPYGHMPEKMVWDADAFIGSNSVKIKLVDRV